MAGTAVLEREIVKRDEERKEAPRETSPAAEEHSRRISENYNALRYQSPVAWADSNVREAERSTLVREERVEAAPVTTSFAAQRIADYAPAPAPAKRKMLFEGLTYKNGALVGTLPAPAPAQQEEDDALPTRRTMETLQRTAAREEAVAVAQKTGFLSALSKKAKIVLLSVVCAIVFAIVAICVNTAIINSLNADITNLRTRAQEEQQTYERLEEELERIVNEEVPKFAEENNMTRMP